jgi:hypothetical protein
MKRTYLLLISIFLSSLMFGQIKNSKNIPFNWKTDTTKTEIDLSELSVVLPRGSFQVLNYPDFIGKEEGLKNFFAKEPIMFVEINGEAKAYSLNMLSVHEIANDTLGGIPILSTFCPLCNSGVVYDRRLTFKGKEHILEFEVSGMLRKSDMVMADKQTETWWQQLMGEAIVGELAGATLKVIPSLVISVDEFFTRFPNGKILSKSAGNEESQKYYGQNFYKNYDAADGKPYGRFFDSTSIDQRLAPMERIVDIRSIGEFKIYTFSKAKELGVINDEFNSKNIVAFYKSGLVSILDKKDITESRDIGTVTIFNSLLDGEVLTFRKEGEIFIDNNTNSHWDITGRCYEGKLVGKELDIEPHGNHFAFAFLAFHPETQIYK